MFKPTTTFCGFSVNDMSKAKKFYENSLGLQVDESNMGLQLKLPESSVFIYQKDDHKPATYTVLNFVVENIDEAVKSLKEKGVIFEQYDEGMIKTDADNIARGKSAEMGPDIAWFKDPAGNFMAVLEN